jgi:outer membrane protein assembly factor BamA
MVEISPGAPLDFFKLEEIRKAIEKLGYFSSVEMDLNYVEDGVEVVYRVKENPVIKEWEVHGSEYMKTLVERKKGEFLGKVGNFNYFSSIIEETRNYYKKKGYVAFRAYFYFEDKRVVF